MSLPTWRKFRHLSFWKGFRQFLGRRFPPCRNHPTRLGLHLPKDLTMMTDDSPKSLGAYG